MVANFLASPGVVALWTGFQCVALVPGGGGAPGSACSYGPGLTATNANGMAIVDSWTCGKLFNKTDFADAPTVRYSLAEEDRTYTLVVVDPDKPGLRYGEYYLHWLRQNIPGKEFYTGMVTSATDLVDWQAPAPPEGSGLHRYQFYVFEQSASKANLTVPSDRTIFHLNNWLQSQTQGPVGLLGHLLQLCGPLAGLQFLAGY